MRGTNPSRSYRRIACACLLIAMLGGGACDARAQAMPSGRANQGMSLYESFQGSSSSSGSVFSMSNTVGYDFTRQFGMDLTLPIYFVLPPTQKNGFAASTTALGNFSMDGRLSLELPLVNYSPTATITFPTGSTTKGFSTGSVTYDFDNRFEHDFDRVTPFFDVDLGNSANSGNHRSRRGIQRPYMTLGKVGGLWAGPASPRTLW